MSSRSDCSPGRRAPTERGGSRHCRVRRLLSDPCNLYLLTGGQFIAPPTYGMDGVGLTDATNACIQPGVPPLLRCAQPDRHLFWDGIHPTRAGHAIIAVLAGKAIVTALANDD